MVHDSRIGSRTWLHARNHADAILFLLQQPEVPPIVNVSGNVELNNREMCRKVAAVLGRAIQFRYVDFHECRPGHDRRYALDGSLLRSMGWTPPVAFDVSLQKMVSWYMANQEWLGLEVNQYATTAAPDAVAP